MTRACKHKHVATKYDCTGLPDPLELSFNECLDCGEWQGMGPSNDADERVRVEIGAAEIASGIVNPAMNPAVAYAAKCGYDDRQTPFAWDCGWNGLERAWHAGYLARCIATHEEAADEIPAAIVVDDVTFQRLTNAIKNPQPPNEALIALFKVKP